MTRSGVVLFLCLAACSTPYTSEEKESSFERHRGAVIGTVPVAEFLRSRTALLLRSVRVTGVSLQGGTLHIKGDGVSGAPGGVGAAVPVAADGYYLTAAHCVSGHPTHRIDGGRFVVPRESATNVVVSAIVTDGRAVRFGTARLVWLSDQGDLALIHCDAAPFGLLEWEAGEPTPDSLVFAAGFPSVLGSDSLGKSGGYAGPSAGLVQGKGLETAEYWELSHDAPLGYGDSGGPLVTSQGKLIGMNTRIMGGLFGRGPSVALRPNREMLNAIIESDRRQHR
jgi:S1-C subfamily serine protease